MARGLGFAVSAPTGERLGVLNVVGPVGTEQGYCWSYADVKGEMVIPFAEGRMYRQADGILFCRHNQERVVFRSAAFPVAEFDKGEAAGFEALDTANMPLRCRLIQTCSIGLL